MNEYSLAKVQSIKTVQRHRENIKAKLQLRSLAQVAAYYLEHIKTE